VEVGHRSGEIAQILEGVHPGDRVALKDPTEGAASK
jgi:hypothetical protein